MRKIGKIKLNQFGQDELDQRRMNALKGGCDCSSKCTSSCSCGSEESFDSNYDLNYDGSDVYMY